MQTGLALAQSSHIRKIGPFTGCTSCYTCPYLGKYAPFSPVLSKSCYKCLYCFNLGRGDEDTESRCLTTSALHEQLIILKKSGIEQFMLFEKSEFGFCKTTREMYKTIVQTLGEDMTYIIPTKAPLKEYTDLTTNKTIFIVTLSNFDNNKILEPFAPSLSIRIKNILRLKKEGRIVGIRLLLLRRREINKLMRVYRRLKDIVDFVYIDFLRDDINNDPLRLKHTMSKCFTQSDLDDLESVSQYGVTFVKGIRNKIYSLFKGTNVIFDRIPHEDYDKVARRVSIPSTPKCRVCHTTNCEGKLHEKRCRSCNGLDKDGNPCPHVMQQPPEIIVDSHKRLKSLILIGKEKQQFGPYRREAMCCLEKTARARNIKLG